MARTNPKKDKPKKTVTIPSKQKKAVKMQTTKPKMQKTAIIEQNTTKSVKKIGRPTKLTRATVSKLVSIFKLGVSDTTACNYAKISRQSYYQYLKSDSRFSDKIAQAKEYGTIASANVVISAIEDDKDLETAKWYLERKDKAFTSQGNSTMNITDSKVLVIPSELLNKHGIVSHSDTLDDVPNDP